MVIHYRGRGPGHIARSQVSSAIVPAIYQTSALATFRTALANRASAPCTIAVAGDSWGYYNGSFGQRWPDLLGNNLRTAFPTTGATSVGGSTYKEVFFSNTLNDGLWNGETSWTSVTGAGGTSGNSGFGRSSMAFGTAGAGYRWSWSGTSCGVYFPGGVGYAAGSVSIAIDGGTPTTVTPSTYGNTAVEWSSGALSNGSHTIDILGVSGGTAALGLMFYNGDESKGIRTMNGARGGATSSEASLMGTYFSDGVLKLAPAKLGIIALTINDYNAQTALATFKTNIQARISDMRTSAGNASLPILLVGWNQPGNIGVLSLSYASYVAKLKEVADADALVAVLDLQDYVPVCQTSGTPDPIGFWHTDRLHPTVYGHSYLGTLVANALGV